MKHYHDNFVIFIDQHRCTINILQLASIICTEVSYIREAPNFSPVNLLLITFCISRFNMVHIVFLVKYITSPLA